MKNTVNEISSTAYEILSMDFRGNIIDSGWYKHLTYESGKPNLNAIIILADIVGWYRRNLCKDMLQKDYTAFSEQFGLTKRQVKEACDFLRDKKVIKVEFRTIDAEYGRKISNVMFIEPVAEELKKISLVYMEEIL
jgi:RNA-binding protein YhbY